MGGTHAAAPAQPAWDGILALHKKRGRKTLGADIVGFHIDHINSFDVFWNTAGAYPQQVAGINGLISWFLPLGKMESKGEDVILPNLLQ